MIFKYILENETICLLLSCMENMHQFTLAFFRILNDLNKISLESLLLLDDYQQWMNKGSTEVVLKKLFPSFRWVVFRNMNSSLVALKFFENL